MNLSGKTREQIDQLTRGYSHDQMVDVIFSLSTVEQLLTPKEIAIREQRSKRDVIRDMKAGKYGGGFFKFAFNSLRASASAVNTFRASFFVKISDPRR